MIQHVGEEVIVDLVVFWIPAMKGYASLVNPVLVHGLRVKIYEKVSKVISRAVGERVDILSTTAAMLFSIIYRRDNIAPSFDSRLKLNSRRQRI